ncbi:MAG: hypothetical protein QM572_06100, partial [Nocardioides sp.]|uniref:hypothetical protein n=1 Tax=Nocardioides sp. TaxID=35761 RepID=UPI0039E2C56C
MGARGKRAGDRPARPLPRRVIALAAGAAVAFTLWVYLVSSAIHFGSRARGGHAGDWWLMGAMTVGAIAALFVALMLGVQAARALGVLPAPAAEEPRPPRT